MCRTCTASYQHVYRSTRLEQRRSELRRWRRDNPAKSKLVEKRSKLNKYKLSIGDFDRMLHEQNGKCAICLQPEKVTNKRGTLYDLTVDHDHTTGVVRGLLCIDCNTSIGKFKDQIDLLESAIRYLRRVSK